MCIKVTLKIGKHWWKLGGSVPLRLGQVVSVDVEGVEDGSTLGRCDIVFGFERLLVVHFSLWIAFQLGQAVSEIVLVDLLYWVK